MESQSSKKGLWMLPFTVQVTRGLLRNERSRRKMMGFSLLVAVIMVITGFTVLRAWLSPHEHPWRFISFWFICAWELVLVLLLAFLDLLLVRAQARAARRAIQEQLSKGTSLDSGQTRAEKNE